MYDMVNDNNLSAQTKRGALRLGMVTTYAGISSSNQVTLDKGQQKMYQSFSGIAQLNSKQVLKSWTFARVIQKVLSCFFSFTL